VALGREEEVELQAEQGILCSGVFVKF